MSRKIQTIDGLPVYDADDTLWLDVVKADIHVKDRRNPEKCAVAEACKRELGVVEARAYLSRLYIRHDGADHWLRYQLPEAIRSEVATFDRGGGFSEGTYRIPPLQPSARGPGAIKGGSGRKNPQTAGTQGKRITHRNVEGVRAHSPLYGGAIEPPPRPSRKK